MTWILLSLLAALFFAIRYVIIKRYLSEVDTYLMAFAYRLFGVLYLLPLLMVFPLRGLSSEWFWAVTIATALLTAVASIMQLKAIQQYELSASVPFLAFIPLFMIIPVFFLYDELPDRYALWGIVLLSVGALVVNGSKAQGLGLSRLLGSRGSVLFFGAAIIFGITTSLDRIPIEEAGNSGFTYTFIWHMVSVVIFGFLFLGQKRRQHIATLKNHFWPFALQGLFGVSAFLCQMLAVEVAREMHANVIYIKSITLLNLLFSVLFGVWLFREQHFGYKLTGALLMMTGAFILMYFSA